MQAAILENLISPVPEFFNFATDVFDAWSERRPDALALWHVDPATGVETKLTFSELSNQSWRAAAAMASQGLGRGSRILIMLPRIPEWWMVMLGAIRLGAIPVPATLQLTERDLAFRIQTAGISGIITDPEGVSKISFSGARFVVGEEQPGWASLARAMVRFSNGTPFRPERTRASDPAILYFTSATTGEPKMVLHSQASYGLGHRLTAGLWLDLKPDDIHWNISDLGWAKAAWSSFYGPWQMGACVFALDVRQKFDPRLTLDTLERYPITTWCAPPTALRFIVKQDLSRWSFPKLRHCVSAGEPLNPEVFNTWRAATNLNIYEAYGQTETVVLIGNFKCQNMPILPGSMGRANPAFDILVLNHDLNPLPDGEEGEIALRVQPVRPLGLFMEYWHNPVENAQKFQGDWYLTGDRAVRDKDGYFWFVGRKDDVIKSSGYRIGPFEVESALIEHPAVIDVGVVGKPDVLRGQIVKAYVVLRPGSEPDDAMRVALQQHCKRLVAAYKYPREIEFVPELPKTISGKTRHVALRQRIAHETMHGSSDSSRIGKG